MCQCEQVVSTKMRKARRESWQTRWWWGDEGGKERGMEIAQALGVSLETTTKAKTMTKTMMMKMVMKMMRKMMMKMMRLSLRYSPRAAPGEIRLQRPLLLRSRGRLQGREAATAMMPSQHPCLLQAPYLPWLTLTMTLMALVLLRLLLHECLPACAL